MLLARLAVDRRFAAKGLGHALIAEVFKITLRLADEGGCRCIITDAYRDWVGWNAKYRFIPIEGSVKDSPRKIFLENYPRSVEKRI